MPGLKGLQRGNFPDSRIRRNWNKMATWFNNMINGDDFELAPDGSLGLTPQALTQKWNAYDNAGGFVIQTTPQSIPYDTIGLNTEATIFTAFSSGEVSIDGNGRPFSFMATVTAKHAASAETNWLCRVWLEVDTGGGFAEVPGSSVNFGNRE